MITPSRTTRIDPLRNNVLPSIWASHSCWILHLEYYTSLFLFRSKPYTSQPCQGALYCKQLVFCFFSCSFKEQLLLYISSSVAADVTLWTKKKNGYKSTWFTSKRAWQPPHTHTLGSSLGVGMWPNIGWWEWHLRLVQVCSERKFPFTLELLR